jgi:Domain of unknown function (DUF4296)
MSRWFFILAIAACITGCGKSGKDKDILPPATMEKVIWDMVQADEFIQAFVLKDSAKVDVNAERYKLYQQVFQLHKTSKEQFKKSFDHYTAHPGENKVIFDSLATKANRRIQEVYKNVQ